MKANELMIGDWVLYNETRQQVLEISGIDDEVYLETDELVHQSEIQPIPLTPEILEKNLATEPQIAWCVGWNKKDDIHVEIKREDLNAAFYGVVDYIHQLQHALRLCGIEKEMIL